MASGEQTTAPLTKRKADLVQAVLRFARADTELRRATAAGTQPRQQRAGNRLWSAQHRMVTLAKEIADGKR